MFKGAFFCYDEHMISWATKRRLSYILGLALFVFAVSAYPAYRVYKGTPSCFDATVNQDEAGVDCGGICARLCVAQVEELSVRFTEVFARDASSVDVVALVENKNISAKIDDARYEFIVFGKNNEELGRKTGSVSVYPRETFVVFEPRVKVTGGAPARVAFSWSEDNIWEKAPVPEAGETISVSGSILTGISESPRLQASARNVSSTAISEADFVAIVSDNKGKRTAVSSTFEKNIAKGEARIISFTWSAPFASAPEGEQCTAPTDVVLAFDRSGSMDDDGASPPQPLTDAKNAAVDFVRNLGPADAVGLVSFATTASDPVDRTLTTDMRLAEQAIREIEIHKDGIQQTNLGDAIRRAKDEILARGRTDAERAIVILTDGVATRPLDPKTGRDDGYAQLYAQEEAQKARAADITLYIIGLGASLNDQFLKDDIAGNALRFYPAVTSDDLKVIYNDIARAVCEEKTFSAEIFVHVKQ